MSLQTEVIFAGNAVPSRTSVPAAAVSSTAHALQLHSCVDALTGLQGLRALVVALGDALVSLDVVYRASLATRLRKVLHESIVECATDPSALDCWAVLLKARERQSCEDVPQVTVAKTGRGHPVLGGGLSDDANGNSVQLSTGLWAAVLRFVVSLEALADGLHAVNRDFRRVTTREPVCWSRRDVTFREPHFWGLIASCNDSERSAAASAGVRRFYWAGWCPAFSLLPAFVEARTLRVAGFADAARRTQAVQLLEGAWRAFCPRTELVVRSFCELHCGEQIDLPTPRCLTARRRGGAKGGGLLLGNWPLEAIPGPGGTECRSFAVQIVDPLGSRLDVGVTSLAPHAQFEALTGPGSVGRKRAKFAEDLASSWIIESSGLLVGSHAGVRFRDNRWDARRLRAGDELRLVVLPTGELQLLLDGRLVATWRAQIPVTLPIYPVVDLFEGSPTIRLLPGEERYQH